MKVRIDDKEALEALSWESLKAYLDRSSDWAYAENIQDKAAVYQHTDGTGRLWEIAVPLRRNLGDYVSRMADAVSILARIEDRSELDVYDDLTNSPAETARKVHQQIRTWLTEDSWIVRDCNDRPGDFALQAMHVAGFIVHILQPREHLDHLTIRTDWGDDDSIKEVINFLPSDTVQEIIWNSFRDATIMGVDFGGFKFPKDAISTSVPLYYDALTKDVLFQRILLVDRALTLTIRAFRRALEAQRQSDQTALTEEQLAKITPLAWRSDQPSTRAS